MILTVTLNPLLERRYSSKNVIPGGNHRNPVFNVQAGGKGINVSRQLNLFSIDNIALTFAGGANGKLLCDILHREQIKFSVSKTKSETRGASVIIDESQKIVTTFFEPAGEITKEEADDFFSRLSKMINTCDMIILSGSSPSENCDYIFPSAIELANKLDKISLCDTYGSHLKDCLEKSPTIVHNNITELENSLNISLSSEEEKLTFLDNLYSKDIKQVYLTDGEKASYCSTFNYHYKVENPKIEKADETGSGDAFVAGVIYGWHNSLTFEENLVFAAACGAANALSFSACRVNINDIENLKKDVVFLPVGKKMKTLDVTPQ